MSTEYSQLLADAMQQNRDQLMAALVKLEVQRVLVDYSGAGDSGDINSVSATPEAAQSQLHAEQILMFYPTPQRLTDGSGFTYTQEQRQVSLHDALSAFAMSWVDSKHGGWENNDGGQGTVTIEVADNTFTLEHTEFFTESSSYEYQL